MCVVCTSFLRLRSRAKRDGVNVGKREAQRILQPYPDRVNTSIASPARERKSITFEAFVAIWERDYLSLSKASTRSGAKSYLKRLKAAFGKKDMRQIDAGDIQWMIAKSISDGLSPKTLRNVWGTVSLIWQAALAQKFVDAALPKPKLPRRPRTKPRSLPCKMSATSSPLVRESTGFSIGLQPRQVYGLARLQESSCPTSMAKA